MHTAGWLTQGKPNTDLEIFIPAVQGITSTGPGVVPSPAASIVSIGGGPAGVLFSGASITGVLYYPLNLLLRTGILQSANFATNTSQEAFGTKASTPGPSAVSGTSGPSGFSPDGVIPPILAVNLPTLKGSTSGSSKKGIQINWIDYVFQVLTAIPTAITGTFSILAFPVGADAAPVVVKAPTSQALGKAINTASHYHRERQTLANPFMMTNDGSYPAIQVTNVLNTTGTVGHLGIVVGCSYNFN